MLGDLQRSLRFEPLEDRRLLSVTAENDGLQLFSTPDSEDAMQLGVSAGGIPSYDFGDAPDSYGTTLAAGGPYHSPFGPVLGPSGDRDREFNGLPTVDANGDDINSGSLAPGPVPAGDDERGVTNFRTDGVAGSPNTFIFRQLGSSKGSVDIQVNDLYPIGDDVILFIPAYITAYIDWNRDGDFLDSNERVVSGAKVSNNGTATYAVNIPDGTTTKAGTSYMRVRVHSEGMGAILPAGGFAYSGEVEDYAITLQPQFTISGDQFEDNDTPATATNLGSGDKSFSGLTIDSGGDDDWYRWLSPTTGQLTVDVVFEQEPGKDVDLYLYDAQGKSLGSSTSFFENEQVKANVTAGQSYLIRVYGGIVHPHYDLMINAPEAPILPDGFENNDTVATAKDLGSGDKSYDGLTIDAAKDDDWYRWQAPASGPLTVDALFTHAANNNIDLKLYNASGNTILDSSESTTNNEQLTFSVTSGESYLIQVYGASGSVHPDYDLVIDGPALAIPDFFEENDTAATARNLGSGDKSYDGLTIDAVGDDDWYRWLAPASGPLRVDVVFAQEPGRDVDLYLYDAQGTPLGSSTLFFDNEQVTIEATTGQSYLIRVYAGSVHPDYALVINGPDEKFAADFNLDGRVDGNDMLILQAGVGILSGAKHADGDADADGDVDFADFKIWQAEYSLPPSATGAAITVAAAPTVSRLTASEHLISAAEMTNDAGNRRPPRGSQSALSQTEKSVRPQLPRSIASLVASRPNLSRDNKCLQLQFAARTAVEVVGQREFRSARQNSIESLRAEHPAFVTRNDNRSSSMPDGMRLAAVETAIMEVASDRLFELVGNDRSLWEDICLEAAAAALWPRI